MAFGNWRYARGLLCLSGVLCLLSGLTGCLALWSLNQDPDGLPCSPEPDSPECLVGYTCVRDTQNPDGLCRKAEIGEEGQTCQADEECVAGLVCRDFYEDSCSPGSTDVNCVLGVRENNRKCRRSCGADDVTCPNGQRCMVAGQGDIVTGWCQEGTCELNSQCGVNAANGANNICFDPSNPPGPSGLCAYGCNPLRCNSNTGCEACPAGQEGCEPIGDVVAGSFSCVPPGQVAYGGFCDNLNLFCAAGSFCQLSASGTGRCTQYCNAQGGAPACDGGLRCNPINAAIGYCY